VNTINVVLSIIGAVVVLIGLLGAATVIMRQGSVRELRNVNTDVRAERDDWKTRYEDEVEARTALEGRVEPLEADGRRKDAALVRIGEQAVGTADIRELAEAVQNLAGLSAAHDIEAATRHRGTVGALVEVRNALDIMRTNLQTRHDPKPPEVKP
jgi:hypothetical protein